MIEKIDEQKWRRRLAAVGCMVAIAAFAGIGSEQAAAASNDGQASLDVRAQNLADREAVHDVLIEYGRLFDHYDFVGYSKLFTSEGTWSGPFGEGYTTAKGPAEIEKMLVDAMGHPTYDADEVASFHLMTNMMIQVDGDRATAQSKWTYFTRNKDNELVPALAGHYDDVLVRENGQWKFLRREVARDIPPIE